jgi:hypothetical protein
LRAAREAASHLSVIPAKAGIHLPCFAMRMTREMGPACAGAAGRPHTGGSPASSVSSVTGTSRTRTPVAL